MGAVAGDSTIDVLLHQSDNTQPLSYQGNFYNFDEWLREHLSKDRFLKYYGKGTYVEFKSDELKVKDSHSGEYVDVYKYTHNYSVSNWMGLGLENNKCLTMTTDHPLPTKQGRKLAENITKDDEIEVIVDDKITEYCKVRYIRPCCNLIRDSYDFETASDRFDVSGICSHNCRTRVMGNIVDPSYEMTAGRGNISMTTMNLPMIALESHGDIGAFYKKLDETIELVKDELLDRFKYQSSNKCLNFPFMMGQGLYHDSEHMDPQSTVYDQIKHGTLTFGFIGLAETLIVLLGKHHGESEYAQKFGLEVIKHIREKANEYSKEYNLNFSLIGSPAEGTTGRFAKILKNKYGIIPRVTDKDYLTNSSHIPVDFPISIKKKIELEAPYHEYCNGGQPIYKSGHLTLVNAATSKRCA